MTPWMSKVVRFLGLLASASAVAGLLGSPEVHGQSPYEQTIYAYFASPHSGYLENAGTVQVEVNLSSPSSQTVTVDFASIPGQGASIWGPSTPATPDEDYQAISGTLEFSPGEVSKTIALTIVDDTVPEGLEVVEIDLSNPTNARIDSPSHSAAHYLTIWDDDSSGDLAIVETDNSTSVLEGDATGDSFTVALSQQPNGSVLVVPQAGDHLAVQPGMLFYTPENWNVPQTVQVTSPDDGVNGPASESSQVTLTATGSGTMYNNLTRVVPVTIQERDSSIQYSPQSGPLWTRVVFTASQSGGGSFSSDTTLTFTGVYMPNGYPPTSPFSVTYAGGNVSIDPNDPNQVAVGLGQVFPVDLLASGNPAVAFRELGTVQGQVILTTGGSSTEVRFAFNITASADVGHLVDNQLQGVSPIPVWKVTTDADLVGVSPNIYLSAEIKRPANEFTSNAPQSFIAQVQSFHSDGSPLSSGVAIGFTLVDSSASLYTYRTGKPFILIDNSTLEGDKGEFVALVGDNSARLAIVKTPP